MFFQNNLLSEVYDLIYYHWKPKKQYFRETQYRDDLMKFLYVNLNQPQPFFFFTSPRRISVKKEAGRGLCDIAVGGNQIGIELKKDLDSKSKVDRLLGQIDRYVGEYTSAIFIVLVGHTTPSTLSDLQERIELKRRVYGPQIYIIRKATFNVSQPKKARKTKRR